MDSRNLSGRVPRIRLFGLSGGLIAGLLLVSAAYLAADEDTIRKRFEKADKNQDGELSREEFLAAGEKPNRAQKLFEKFDKNSDGSLVKAELKEAIRTIAKNQAANATPAGAKKKQAMKPKSDVKPETTEPVKTEAADPEPKATVAADRRASTRDPLLAAAAIDREIEQALAKNQVPASGLASDAEFIRRLSLDLRGRIPTFAETEQFLKDPSSEKRRKLIDEYLADDEYGEHFAIIWYHRIAKPDDDNQRALVKNHLQAWLADSFNQNRGWDGIVDDLLTASGNREQNPATTFWLTAISDAKTGQPDPAKATAAASRLFMGIRLECCECHNHPFTPLKQTDFWGTAAFFTQTRTQGANQGAAKNDAIPEVFERAGFAAKKKKKKGPTAEKPAAVPFGSVAIPYESEEVVEVKFLGAETPEVEGKKELRPVFADWLTASSNPYFARAAVNKLWANFFGRGIVDPIDDMQNESTNTHPALLSLLTEEFIASEFDQKHLIRCICNSQVYQRTSQPVPENKSDEVLYSKMPLKIMTADMLYDSMATALGHQVAGDARRGGAKKKKGGGNPRDEFRKFFHAEADDDAGIVADYSHGVPQVLRLMNARQINDTTAAISSLMKSGGSSETVIQNIYLTVLSRAPTDAEIKRASEFVAGDKDAANGYGDLMWALLNTSEFLFNH